MFNKTILLFTGVILLILNSCKDNIAEPDDKPGRRDYEWTIDTINSYDPIYRLWGSSPTDLWAITSGGNLYESIFHFDGNNWKTDGEFRFVLPYSIWGFAKNNVYIGGSGGKIWHFDGSAWTETAVLSKDGYKDIVFDNMWGESPNDFYAFGAYHDEQLLANNSVIARFKNNQWTMLNTNGITGIVERLFKSKPDQLIYLQVIKFSNSFDSTFIYEYNKGKYTRLYGTIWSKTWADISLINNEVYFVLENEIAKRINGKFQTVIKIDNSNFYQKIWGKNSKDIFLSMTNGLAHYNGSDIEYLFHFNMPQAKIFGAALFEEKVFFLVNGADVNLIYEGRLK